MSAESCPVVQLRTYSILLRELAQGNSEKINIAVCYMRAHTFCPKHNTDENIDVQQKQKVKQNTIF